MKQKKVTFADIAAYTGFSKTTISRYFNNPDSLTLENQEKITHALDVLGYQENKLAKVLANGKSEFVGIIIPNLYLHYYSEMLNQLLSTYEKYNYKFLVFIGNNKKEIEEKFIATIAKKVAMKSKKSTTFEEVDCLMKKLLVLDNPFLGPQNKSIAFKLSEHELEKKLSKQQGGL